MNCEQSQNLFDAYLDGELSAPLETELLSHLVDCSDCRRSMALLEVAGHVIKADEFAPQLSDSFSDRLLACMADEPSHSYLRFRGLVRWGLVGLGAAAATAFAVGALSGNRSLVAGSKEKVQADDMPVLTTGSDGSSANGENGVPARVSRPTWEPVEKTDEQSAITMEDWSRMTVMQLLNALGVEPINEPETGDSEAEARDPLADISEDPNVEEF